MPLGLHKCAHAYIGKVSCATGGATILVLGVTRYYNVSCVSILASFEVPYMVKVLENMGPGLA